MIKHFIRVQKMKMKKILLEHVGEKCYKKFTLKLFENRSFLASKDKYNDDKRFSLSPFLSPLPFLTRDMAL